MIAFLLGAGFNLDANVYKPDKEYIYGYPLVGGLAHICFDSSNSRRIDNIEVLFQEAIQNHQWDPIRKLSDCLMLADNCITPTLRLKSDSPYIRLLTKFPGANFITFNYDSLVEILLFYRGEWFPEDGYGIPVKAEKFPTKGATILRSKSKVIHLHGSLCIYTSDFKLVPDKNSSMKLIELKDVPDFIFEPASISSLFYPYNGGPLDPAYDNLWYRIIAPIPNKAEGLKETFIQHSYKVSETIISESELLTCIGYNFSEHDESSYIPILNAARRYHVPILMISPSAKAISERLCSKGYTDIKIMDVTLKEWADSNFPVL